MSGTPPTTPAPIPTRHNQYAKGGWLYGCPHRQDERRTQRHGYAQRILQRYGKSLCINHAGQKVAHPFLSSNWPTNTAEVI